MAKRAASFDLPSHGCASFSEQILCTQEKIPGNVWSRVNSSLQITSSLCGERKALVNTAACPRWFGEHVSCFSLHMQGRAFTLRYSLVVD